MNILVTGTPGSGKSTLTQYAQKLKDRRFYDADEIEGLCEWREFESGKVLGLVTEYIESGLDEWYQVFGWYWRTDILKAFLNEHPDAIICGSAENTVECYPLFKQIAILKKTDQELLSNLASPDRNNPFGQTPDQRKNFMNWQDYLIKGAAPFNPIILSGNDISKSYDAIIEPSDSK
jgi:hypothetical protein